MPKWEQSQAHLVIPIIWTKAFHSEHSRGLEMPKEPGEEKVKRTSHVVENSLPDYCDPIPCSPSHGVQQSPQPQHWGHTELDNSLLWMADKGTVGCFAASISDVASTYGSCTPTPSCDKENVSRPQGAILSLVEKPTGLERAADLEISLKVGISHWSL